VRGESRRAQERSSPSRAERQAAGLCWAALAGLGLLALRVPVGSAQGDEAPRYHPFLLDCAAYRTVVRSEIYLQGGNRRSRESAGRDGVMQLRAAAADSLIRLEGWFDTLLVWREGSGERLEPNTDGLVGGRYRGLLTGLGGFRSIDAPFLPDEVAEVADLSGALGDLLPPLPPVPLIPGASWRDDHGMVITRLPDETLAGRRLARYRLIRRSTHPESRLLSDSTEVRASRTETESGAFDWSTELGVVRWERDLADEVTVPTGGPVKQAFRTKIEQKVTVDRVRGGVRRVGDVTDTTDGRDKSVLCNRAQLSRS
jgi:hypothetical protein